MSVADDQALLAFQIKSVSADLQEIKASMRDLAAAVARLAVIEERQNGTNESLGRAFMEITRLTGRVVSLEQSQPMQKHSSELVQSVVKYVLVAILGAVLSGLIRTPVSLPTAQPPALTSK